jgi:hypothetical protein
MASIKEAIRLHVDQDLDLPTEGSERFDAIAAGTREQSVAAAATLSRAAVDFGECRLESEFFLRRDDTIKRDRLNIGLCMGLFREKKRIPRYRVGLLDNRSDVACRRDELTHTSSD